jgi:hypothetical protein
MQLENIIGNLKTMLPAQDFILTGSFVLAKYGLRPWDSVHDLDIILVKPEVSAIELINRYMTDFPAPSTTKCTTLSVPKEEEEEMKDFDPPRKKSNLHADPKNYVDNDEEDEEKVITKKGFVAKASKSETLSIFMFDKVKIDIFIKDNFNETTLTVELENKMACKFTTIPHIIKAKQSYGRMKDWLQCRDMSRLLFLPEAFTALLNSDWKHSLRQDY